MNPWKFKSIRKHKAFGTHRKHRFGSLDEAVSAAKDFQKEVTKLSTENNAYKIVLSNNMETILKELVSIAATVVKNKAIDKAQSDQVHDDLFTLKKGVESWKTSIYFFRVCCQLILVL